MDFLVSLSFIMFLEVFPSVAHSQCTTTNSFNCGKWNNLAYPFWRKDEPHSKCNSDEFKLINCHTEKEDPSVHIQYQDLRVKNISMEDKTMRLSLPIKYPCVPLNDHMFQLLPPTLSSINIFYRCNPRDDFPGFPRFRCGSNDLVYWETEIQSDLAMSCKNSFHVMNGATLDVIKSSNNSHELWNNLQNALQTGFEVSTIPPPPPPSLAPADYDPKRVPKKEPVDIEDILVIGFCVFGGTCLIMCGFFVFYQRLRRAMYARLSYKSRNISSDTSSITDPENMVSLYGLKFFSYDELKEATDNFSESREIGDGGFGTVYLGKLQDGRTVAVKRLYENNYKRVELFLNEVDILARLRHTNLVTLYGCTSRHSRELLLVYEYMSNGTVADHLHGENAQPGKLLWQTRLKIAVETAGALKYLHASDIIHRDVKTNNILLDDNFNVKVADFGLSRLFPLHVTHVTTVPQGTPGYVDPEYRQCYQLTDKSDVYSFGVVLVELISSKPAVDITRSRHEINLSSMAINKIQNGDLHELVDPLLGFDRDSDVRRMISAVAELAFRCLQSDRDLRPSMQQVLEILISIQCGDSQLEDKVEELDNFSDEFVLLKKQSSELDDS